MRIMLALPGVAMVPLAWGTAVELRMTKWGRHIVTLMVLTGASPRPRRRLDHTELSVADPERLSSRDDADAPRRLQTSPGSSSPASSSSTRSSSSSPSRPSTASRRSTTSSAGAARSLSLEPLLVSPRRSSLRRSGRRADALNLAARRPFEEDWWVWLTLTGISIGCVCSCVLLSPSLPFPSQLCSPRRLFARSVKWVGMFVTALVGIYTVEDLWNKFGDLRMSYVSSSPCSARARGQS